jgi:hypothetical protein
MGDFIRVAGRRTHIDLYDAGLHDLTVAWVAANFSPNGAASRFAPRLRTVGGVATSDPGCGPGNDASCEDDARRCGFAYNAPLAVSNCDPGSPVPPGVGASADGRRSQNWERREPPLGGQCGVEDGQVGSEACHCPHTDVPVAGTGRYFSLAGARFPMFTRSSSCSPEYVGPQVAVLLAELDELHGLIAADWETRAVFAPEPPVKGAGAAARIDSLRSAVRLLVADGEGDVRLLRIPGRIPGGVGVASPESVCS